MEDEGFIRIEMPKMRASSKLLTPAPWEELCPAPFGEGMDVWRNRGFFNPGH